MREIKFRVWDYEEKKMWYQDMKWGSDFIIRLNGDVDYQFRNEDKTNNHHIEPVIDCELMQYTGLKDKNGVEIYEGDVVAMEQEYDGYYGGVVKFKDGRFYIDCDDWDDCLGWDSCDKEFEVIGNVHANLELIKE